MSTQGKQSLAEWRAARVHEVTLPSGLIVKLRKITIMDMVLRGKVSNGILAMADDAAKDGGDSLEMSKLAENAVEFNDMLDAMIQLSLVEPKIGAEEDEEHIALSDLSSDDKMAIFNFLNGDAQAPGSAVKSVSAETAAAS
jgi:hypothetical protein